MKPLHGLMIGIAVALTSCSSSAPESADVNQEPEAKPDKLTIRVYADPFKSALDTACAVPFTEKTGIPVEWDTADEGPSHAKVVQAIRAGSRPPVDASFQLQTRGYLNGVQDLSIPISPSVATNLGSITEAAAKPADLPDDNGWQYVNVYSFTVPLIYRTDMVDPSEVVSWRDLFSERFRNNLEIDNQYGGTAFAIAKMMGIDPADGAPESMAVVWEEYAALRPNIAIVGSDADSVKALTTGEAVISIHGSQNKVAAEEAGAPVDYLVPEEGVFMIGDAFYIHRNIPDENAYYAQVFINECLSAEAQGVLAEQLAVIPVNPEAQVPAEMAARPDVFPVTEEQVADSAIVAPIPLMARYQEDWQSAFEAAVK